MDEQHKRPRIAGNAQNPRNLRPARGKLPRRAALKGLSAIAVAVGCGADRAEPTPATSNAAGRAATDSTPTSAQAGSRASTTSSASTAAGSQGSASGAGAPAAGAAAPPAAGTVAVPTAGGAGASPSSAAGSAATGGTAAGSSAAGGAGGVAGATSGGTSLAALQCIVTPAMTEGPFFIEEKLLRSNLVMGETEDAIIKACPMKLVIGVYQVDGMQCAPLSGVAVDIWHADALGVYSDVASGIVQSVDTRGKQFLRGYQVTDELGIVQFETIYPGWYMSRTIHIHFKLRKQGGSGSAVEFTSQMFFDENISTKVLATGAYASHKGQRSVLNDDDHIYNGTASNGQKPRAGVEPPGKSIMPTLVADGSGYTATLKLGLRG